MIEAEIDYLDGEFQVNEQDPSVLSELTSLIGEDGVIKEASNNLRYRNKYPRVYRKVSAEVVSRFAFKRDVKEKKTLKDGTVKEILVSENDHLRAYLATDSEENPARKNLQALFDEIAPAEPLYVKGERIGGGGKVAQGALDAANKHLAAGPEKVQKVVEVIEAQVPGYKVGRDENGEVTPEGLARGLQALQKKLEQAAKQQAAALLA